MGDRHDPAQNRLPARAVVGESPRDVSLPSMLQRGDAAPDFRVGDRSLHEMLRERAVVLFFFPKAFTAG
jgi:hypothetical protein